MLAAVMSGTPDWSALDTTSTPLRSMIQCCLDEEETRRFNSISEARAALDNLSGRVRPRSRSRFVAVVIAIAIVMSIGLGYMGIRMLSTPDIPWIGVLPMRSVDGTADSLANSTTEELTAALGQLGPNVRVKSFSAMRSYRESEKPISAIAQELGVNYLLEGSVQQSETGIVVKASLVAANDTPLWSNTYRRDDADVLTLQRELVRDIAAEIRVKPALEHEHAPVRVVPAAYQTYRAGVDKSRSSEPQALLASVDLFKEAIRIDPNFAAPHAALARVHADMGFASIMPPGDAYPLAGMEAQEALALDPTNEDATLTRIRIRVDHDWDFVKAESEYMELIGKNPNNTDAYGFYSQLLVALGRTEEALAMNKRTLEFDPRSMESAYRESWIQYMARRPDASIAGWQKVQAAFPSPQLGLAQLGDAYALVGRNEDAFIHYQQALRSGEADPSRITTLDAAYGSGGLNGYLRKLLEVHEIHTYDRASLHARLGDKKDAIAWLIKAYEERHNRMIFIKVDPAFDAIREEPEFLQLIKKVGLTP
jgi:TolB-like protein/tetratricopeptide (TPR) repeat protein